MPAHQLISSTSLLFTLVYAHCLAAEPLDAATDTAKVTKRIVHRFDFDERGEGNLEEVPRYWTPLRGDGFPRFARGGFDESIGHTTAPSFHLQSVGRNVAFQYNGPEIPVHLKSEYRLEGFVRMAGMATSRACVSAFFLDQYRQPLLDTTRRTPYIEQKPGTDWSLFELHLPPAPYSARYLGLALWILQENVWGQERSQNELTAVDVAAQAWFDDIIVYRQPRLEMTTKTPGEVIDSNDEPVLWVTLADSLDPHIEADLEIRSADGRLVLQQRIVGSDQQSVRIDLSPLEPGLYDAAAQVLAEEHAITACSVRFLKLPALSAGVSRSRRFGIVLDSNDRVDPKTELALLQKNAASSVKIPVGSKLGEPGERRGSTPELYAHMLFDNHFSLTAIIGFGKPGKPESQALSSESLPAELLDWETDIQAVAADSAGLFRWWQTGADGEGSLPPATVKSVSDRLRKVLLEYISLPRLGSPISALDGFSNSVPAESVTINVANSVGLTDLFEKITQLRKQSCEEVSVFASPLPDWFVREARMAEWAKRLIEARFAGADVVFVPQLWHNRQTFAGLVVEPTEEYQVFRTIASVLGESVPGPQIPAQDQVRALSFRTADRWVVAVWDANAPPEGRTISMQLGSATRQVDIWGHSVAISRDSDGRQLVHVSQSPVFIDRVDSWVVELATSFSMEPAVVESATELVHHDIVMDCKSQALRSGTVVIVPPAGIDVLPRDFSFSTCDGKPTRVAMTVQYPHSEPVGTKIFLAKIRLVDPAYDFEVPMRVELQTSDIEVKGQATIQRGSLLLRHTIRNNSNALANFRSIASVPGRQRQYRPVSALAPGETQTVEYRFREGNDLIGRRVSLTLRQLDDGPRQHNLEIVVP